MQYIDLKTQYEQIKDPVCQGIDRILSNQQYIFGPEVGELEQRLAEYVGVKHVFGCSSGTDALVIPLMCYQLSADDAVFVPSFSFFASGESVSLAGGTPVFVDSCADSFNISPTDLERAIAKTIEEGKLNPRGIITVDLFGQPANYEELWAIASKYDLFLLEDAAQGFGGEYFGKKACSLGNIGATSFYPAKPLGCYGDGGAIFTDDDGMAELIKSIRVHGQGANKYDNERIGVNGRLDTIQAAVLLAKLDIFPAELEARNEIASKYKSKFVDYLSVPDVPDSLMSSWAQFTLLARDTEERESIIAACKERGVPICIFYPTPMHLSSAYKGLGYKIGDLPVCENLASRCFSVPMHPYLSDDDIDYVAECVKKGLL